MLALPHYDLILREVAHVGPARWDPWLDTHPTDMRPPKSAWGTIRVKFRVGIPMLFVRICAYMRPCRGLRQRVVYGSAHIPVVAITKGYGDTQLALSLDNQ